MGTQGIFGQRPDSSAMRKERWLRVAGCGELVGGPLEAKAAQIRAERGIDFAEHSSRDRKRVGEVLTHAWLLRALAGKEEYDIH